jgi:hypothetical protein
MSWLRGELDAAGRREQLLLTVGDGSYDSAELWTSLPERTVLLARTARNRALFALPVPEPKRRGARRKYGERARTPAAWLQEHSGWQEATLEVRGRRITTRYRVEGVESQLDWLWPTFRAPPRVAILLLPAALQDRRLGRRSPCPSPPSFRT